MIRYVPTALALRQQTTKKIAFQWPEQRIENSRKANFIEVVLQKKTRAQIHKRALNGASVYLIKAPRSIEIVFINWSWEVGPRGHRQQASASEECNFVTWRRSDPDTASLWPPPCQSKKATMKRWNFIAFQRNCGFLCFYDRAKRGGKKHRGPTTAPNSFVYFRANI